LSKKVKYIYSKENQQFEPHKVSIWTKVFRVLGILSGIVVAAWIIVALAFKYIGSPREKRMRNEMNNLKRQYTLLQKNINNTQSKLKKLQRRDNEIYRVIFEAEPLPDNNLQEKLNLERKVSNFSNVELIKSIEEKMGELEKQIQTQNISYDSLLAKIQNKEEMLMSIPSIQPVSNKNLKRIASGFGYRVDPIYKIRKFHAGLDFTAPQGTPIYATGNGVIEQADYSTGGYGNQIWINHGYGYRTHYAHMVKIKKTSGTVKRGEVIGYVGSTGKSTGPHLHYEVERKGQKIDPIHFFYNDLAVADYDKILEIARRSNQSFD
jgi:murein DD-endopeptidase MepM/ murein hydrolase activator NlpD